MADAQPSPTFSVETRRSIYRTPWISVFEDRVSDASGGRGVRSVVKMKAGSTIVAIADDEQVTLVREYRYAIGRLSVEAVSGGMEEGESPLAAAKRELHEEVGLVARDWTALGVIDPFTAMVQAPNYMFLAQELTSVPACPDEGEHIEPLRVSLADAVSMVKSGEITHGASCVAILLTGALLRNPY